MAESKFIKFQDSNGNRLVDVCDDFIPAPEEKICLECRPNPLAIVSDWKNRRPRSIEFNQKKCTYELSYQTFERGTISEDTNSVDEMFEKYKEKAVIAFFVSGDKKQNPEDLELVRNSILLVLICLLVVSAFLSFYILYPLTFMRDWRPKIQKKMTKTKDQTR